MIEGVGERGGIRKSGGVRCECTYLEESKRERDYVGGEGGMERKSGWIYSYL